MAENQSAGNDTGDDTITGLVESSRRYLEAITEVWVQSVDQAARAGQWTTSAAGQLVPTPSADYAVPTPKQLLDTSFELAQQVLNLQRQIAGVLLGGPAAAASGDDQATPGRAGQRAENAQPASGQPEAGQQPAQQAQQGSQVQAAEGQGQEMDLRTSQGRARTGSEAR